MIGNYESLICDFKSLFIFVFFNKLATMPYEVIWLQKLCPKIYYARPKKFVTLIKVKYKDTYYDAVGSKIRKFAKLLNHLLRLQVSNY